MRASATIFYLFARLALGSLLIAHALAHGVLALRGAVDWTPASIHGQLPAAAYCFAVVALFAAGLGVLGSSVFRRHAEWLFGAGLVASMTALVFNWNEAARWGLALDGFVLAAFMIARPTGIVVIGPAAPVDLRRWRLSRWVVEIVSCALVAYVAIATAGWPQYRQWGSTSPNNACRSLAIRPFARSTPS